MPDKDFVSFIAGIAFLCVALTLGIAAGNGLMTHYKKYSKQECQSAYIAAVVSQLDVGARNQLQWITAFETADDVLNRPECKDVFPNRK